jgi:hypothetical protein
MAHFKLKYPIGLLSENVQESIITTHVLSSSANVVNENAETKSYQVSNYTVFK